MNSLNSSRSRSVRNVRITIAQREDAERITAVINAAFRRAEEFFVDGDRVDESGVLNYFSSGKFLLAESEGTLLGCVYVEPRMETTEKRVTGNGERKHLDRNRSLTQSQDRAYLGLLSVDPAHQQSGLGSLLMDAAENYSRRLGFVFMDIKVVSLREELFGFYRKRGYVETGTSAFPADVETSLPCHFIDMSKSLNEDAPGTASTD
jgi:ribosomal protein S18 acetylase RimI-like enzyme